MSLLSDIALAIKTKLGGTSTNNTIPRYDGTTCTLKKSDVTISDTNVVTAGGGFVGNLTGTASNATLAVSATKLATARTINGVSFNGTANITIADSTKAPLTGGGTSGTWGISITGNASTANNAALAANATKLATERFINGVAFDGTADITIADSTKAPLNGTGATGTWGINITGNSASTTKLATARTINGVSFDGTTNITVADSTKAPLISPALTGTPTSTTATDGTNTTQIATTAFVQNAVGGYLSKAVTGGTITLTAAEASNPVVAFSGALTSAVVIVVPTTTKRIWAIYNATSGAFTLTVKTAAGNGVTVAQGKRNLVYTDGTHVYDAFNDYESITLTGVSSAPTAAVGTNTTQLATTAFVNAEIANDAPTKTGSGASGTWGISVSGNAATATTLTGLTATVDELNYVDGVTSNIQTQLAGKLDTTATVETATKLATARTINGVAFDGTANIVAPTNLGITAGTTAGPIVTSSSGTNATLPSASATASGVVTTGAQTFAGVKTFSSTITGSVTGNSGTATKLATARTINGVAFDGTANITVSDSTAVNLTEAQTIEGVKTFSSTISGSISGNAGTATKLATVRTINGVNFDGSANITVVDSTKAPLANPVFTGGITEKVYNLTGTAITPANGTIQYKTVSANTIFTETLTAGQSVVLRLVNASSYTITFPAMTWAGETAPVLTANCVIVLWKEQTALYGAYVGSLV